MPKGLTLGSLKKLNSCAWPASSRQTQALVSSWFFLKRAHGELRGQHGSPCAQRPLGVGGPLSAFDPYLLALDGYSANESKPLHVYWSTLINDFIF